MADEQNKRGKTTVSRMVALEGDVAVLKTGQAEARRDISELRKSYCVLTKDIAEIKARQAEAATKSDVEHAINGILRDALQSVPAEQANRLQERAERLQRRANWIALAGVLVAGVVGVAGVLHLIG